MCTVTLRRDASGLLLTMNRDELRMRGEEIAPGIAETGDPPLRWLGPRDAARGGTWIGVNEHGLSAALMNGNVPMETTMRAITAGAPSRGAIVPAALAAGRIDDALHWLAEEFDPGPYPAFMLLLAATDRAVLTTWWGQGPLEQRNLAQPWDMVSSSQWETEAVLRYRAAAFEDWLASGAVFDGPLPAVHRFRKPGEEALAIQVERGYACTRSITQIAVPGADAPITMRYAPIEEDTLHPFSVHTLGPPQ